MNNIFKFPTAEQRKSIPPKITRKIALSGELGGFNCLKGDVIYADKSLPIREGDLVMTEKQVFEARLKDGEVYLDGRLINKSEILGRVFRIERDL